MELIIQSIVEIAEDSPVYSLRGYVTPPDLRSFLLRRLTGAFGFTKNGLFRTGINFIDFGRS
jgi:hypothetical protein